MRLLGAWWVVLFLSWSCVFGLQNDRGQPTSTSREAQQWGIVIGISRYIGLPEIPSTSQGAKEFADFLLKTKGTVRLLANATLYDIRRAFEEIRGRKEPIDVLYVYFAGYGVGDEKDGYLLPRDVELGKIPSRSLTLRELQSKLEDNPARHIILVVEAIHHPMLGRALGLSDLRENRIIEHLKKMASEKMRWVTLLAVLSEVNEDRGVGEGVLIRHLVAGLEGEADADKDGVVWVRELLQYIRKRLPLQAEGSPWGVGLIARTDPMLVVVSRPKESSKSSPENPPTETPATKQPVAPEPPPSKKESCRNRVRDKLEEAERNPFDPNAHRELAQAYKEAGCFEEAITEYQFIVSKLGRDEAWAHNELAQVYQHIGKFEEAERGYRRAIELKPENPDLRYNLGQLYYNAGRYAEAIEEFDRALALKPSNPAEIYYAKGLAYHKQKNYAEAIRQYDEALKLDSDRAEVYYAKGLAYDDQGNVGEAILQYKKALELDPMGRRIESEKLRKRLAELGVKGIQ